MKEITPLLLQCGKTIEIILDMEMSHEAPGYISHYTKKIADDIFKEIDVY